MQFIEKQSHGIYVVTVEAKTFLSTLLTPLSVVSVAGLYRSGKSSLLNILSKETFPPITETFGTSSSTNAKTFGLWFSPNLLHGRVLLIDSEGLGSTAAHISHDVNIIALSMLLSSMFIYNSSGPINTSAINELAIAEKVAKMLTKNNDNQIFKAPELIWISRDFSLELHDENANDYLQHCLLSAAEQPDSVAEELQVLFTKKSCVLLPRPTSSVEDLRQYKHYSSEFLFGIDLIREKIEMSTNKTFVGKMVTGPILLSITESFLDQINSGAVPSMDNVWTAAQKASHITALSSSIQLIQHVMSTSGPTTSTLFGLYQTATTNYITNCLDPSIPDLLNAQVQFKHEIMQVQEGYETLWSTLFVPEHVHDIRQFMLPRPIETFVETLLTTLSNSKERLVEKTHELALITTNHQYQLTTMSEELGFETSITDDLRKKTSQMYSDQYT